MSGSNMAASSYLSSPDEISPYYPERFIRPLPRRSIRSRLSSEAAGTISYPPNPPSASLPAYSHYGEDEKLFQKNDRLTNHQDYEHEHEHDSFQDEDEHDHDCPHSHHHHHHHHHHCHHHDDEDDDLDSVEDASPTAQRHGNAHRASPRSPRSQRHGRYNSYSGKSSSAPDGYEAFENTNNKKKRKIPTSGSLSIHQGGINSDFAHMGSLSVDGSSEDVTQDYHTSPSGGLGMQGAGRGRSAAKKSNVRNPLGVSTNGSNVRAGSAKYDQGPATNMNGSTSNTDQGIISKAIANATTLLRNPMGKGQENVGVLDQQAKTTPTNSQFTFTCEADAKGVKFPEQSLYSPDYAHRVNSAPAAAPSQTHKYNSQGTQHTATGAQQPHPGQALPNNAAPQQKQKTRRRKGDVYALAARQRKLQQEYTNMQHTSSREDIWICEFCEYESIFGSPPHALVRQYEIKDRRERKRLAEKRRLLEKAKLKGRKGKKQSKNAAKAANSAAQQPINQQNYDQQPLDQMDEYLDDGYDDDPVPLAAPPPQALAKQAMPGSYDRGGGGPAGRAYAGSAGIAGGGAEAGTIR